MGNVRYLFQRRSRCFVVLCVKLNIFTHKLNINISKYFLKEIFSLFVKINLTHTSYTFIIKYYSKVYFVRILFPSHCVLENCCLGCINKIQQDATVCRYLFTAKSLYMFQVSIAPIIRSTYNVRPKSIKTSCFKRVLCVTSSGRHRNYVVLCFM